MKATRIFYISILFLSILTARAQQLIDPQATKETQALYKNLHLLSKRYTLFGHQDDLAYGVKWDHRAHPMSRLKTSAHLMSDINMVVGDFPAVYGWDLGGIEKNSLKNIDGVPFANMREYIKAGYHRGAVITLSWHFDNPLTGGSTWDTTRRTVHTILPGGTKHEIFKSWLDRAASFISTLKGAHGEAIPVLFRPFHELNGDWFWWGKNKATADEFKAIWKFTINYLRNEKGLHNLIIVYNTNSFANETEFLEKYPGDDLADVLSFDKYQFTNNSEEFIRSTRKELITVARLANEKNKLAAFAETGYEAIPDAKWWTKTLAPIIKGIPISYVLVWRNAGYMPSMKKMHYYAPYKGQGSAADFKKFYQIPSILFEKTTKKKNIYQ
ncbi:glycosyl hydrolase [Pedobacter sp. Du54]|uniref:glycoside hydrolase family 26 protein n=1 Tax=Pedobacter anseongensis TaxID=3133439 RepID=UPI00309C8966